MSASEAYGVLGLAENTPFEVVVKTKNKLLSEASSMDSQQQVEQAYDVLLMKNMKRRLSGELEVSTSVRYADVPQAPSKKSIMGRQAAGGKGPVMATRGSTSGGVSKRGGQSTMASPSVLGLSLATPRDTKVAATQAAVFGSLAVWALVQASLESPEVQLSDTAGLQLALALGYSIYSLKENKRLPLGKAAGVSMVCLIIGAVIGTGVETWLRVDIVPLGTFASPGVMVSEFVFALLAAGTILLV